MHLRSSGSCLLLISAYRKPWDAPVCFVLVIFVHVTVLVLVLVVTSAMHAEERRNVLVGKLVAAEQLHLFEPTRVRRERHEGAARDAVTLSPPRTPDVDALWGREGRKREGRLRAMNYNMMNDE